jgi:protein-tyrosine phosphatase
MSINHNPQDKNITSVLNFRDLGGLSAAGEMRIREGIIFRSANPDRISRRDLERLHSLNIRTIIDLRAPFESSKKPRSLDPAQRISLPIDFQQTTRERLKPIIRRKNSETLIADISNTLYLEILDSSGPVIKQVMDTLNSREHSPLLIHCHAGKDRTGIICALILLALGAERESIISDFMESNIHLRKYFKKLLLLRTIFSFGFFPYRNMLFAVMVRQRNIESILDRIEGHYGGIESYLTHAGFETSKLVELRKNMVVV